jgi:undecaprenyl-diphosphatase
MIFFQITTYIGDSLTWVGLTLLLLILNKKNPRQAVKLCSTLAIVWIAVTVLRYTLNYPRPFQRFPQLVTAYALEIAPSYPSGHTATIVAGSYILAKHQKLLNVLSFSLVILVAISRVALGLHYYSDIIGGALLSYPLAATIDDFRYFTRFK